MSDARVFTAGDKCPKKGTVVMDEEGCCFKVVSRGRVEYLGASNFWFPAGLSHTWSWLTGYYSPLTEVQT